MTDEAHRAACIALRARALSGFLRGCQGRQHSTEGEISIRWEGTFSLNFDSGKYDPNYE